MQTFIDGLKWLIDGAHWTGFDGIPVRILEHVEVSAAAVIVAAALAVPIGLYIGHTRRFEFLAVSVANIGRSIPSFGVLVIAYVVILELFPSLAFGFTPTLVALILLAVPPILTNTYVGIEGVDQDAVEAARGMGMSERQVVFRLELPLAIPLILAGLRTAAVTVIATATLSALVGGGTLGRYIVDGLAQSDEPKVVAGAILVAILAIATELVLAALERAVTPATGSRRDPIMVEQLPRAPA
jgi:osmoprotectant transport system permease protein